MRVRQVVEILHGREMVVEMDWLVSEVHCVVDVLLAVSTLLAVSVL